MIKYPINRLIIFDFLSENGFSAHGTFTTKGYPFTNGTINLMLTIHDSFIEREIDKLLADCHLDKEDFEDFVRKQ